MNRIQWMGIISAIIIALCIPMTFISLVSAAETIISVNDYCANQNESINISINIYNAKDIGSVDISLRYDPSVLSLKGVEKGNITQNSVIQWNTKGDKVLIGLIDVNGINGNGSLATLTFDVLGYPGSTSVLDLEANAHNTTFSPIPLTTKNGNFTVIGSTVPSPSPTPLTPLSPSSGGSSTRASSPGGGVRTPTESEGLTIDIEDIYAYPDTTIKIPINVQNASDIGSIDFHLDFNSSVLNLLDISKSELTKNSLLQWVANNNKTRIVIIDASGINGNGPLVYLNFNVIGAPHSISNLNVTDLEMSDVVSTEEIPATINNGSLTVKPVVNKETVDEDNKTKITEIPVQKTPLETPTKEKEPAKRQPGFEAVTSALAIALLAILFMLRRARKKK